MVRLTTSKDDDFVEFICDQLEALEVVTYKPMFGGYGLYCGVLFFGIVFDGRLYFKTDDDSRKRYTLWDSAPFQPNAKQTLKSYYEVPIDVIEDAEQLGEWGEEAVEVAANRTD